MRKNKFPTKIFIASSIAALILLPVLVILIKLLFIDYMITKVNENNEPLQGICDLNADPLITEPTLCK